MVPYAGLVPHLRTQNISDGTGILQTTAGIELDSEEMASLEGDYQFCLFSAPFIVCYNGRHLRTACHCTATPVI